MTEIQSKTGTIRQPEEKIYQFVSDFNNFGTFIPADKVKDWESTSDSCSFTVNGMGRLELKIQHKEPSNLIKIAGSGIQNLDFLFWIQLKQTAESETKVRLTIKADLNPIMKMIATKPLQMFVDSLVDQMERL